MPNKSETPRITKPFDPNDTLDWIKEGIEACWTTTELEATVSRIYALDSAFQKWVLEKSSSYEHGNYLTNERIFLRARYVACRLAVGQLVKILIMNDGLSGAKRESFIDNVFAVINMDGSFNDIKATIVKATQSYKTQLMKAFKNWPEATIPKEKNHGKR